MSLLDSPNPHHAFVEQQLPRWAQHLSQEDWQRLRQSLQLPIELAGVDPDLFTASAQGAAILASQAALRQAQRALAIALKDFKGVMAFAEPLLQSRLQQVHNLSLDVRQAQLLEYRSLQVPWAWDLQTRRKPISLLQAALHNFLPDQAFDQPSALLRRLTPGQAPSPTQLLPLTPADFATLCRTLDLGHAYQTHLNAQFTPATRRLWIAATQARLRADVELARWLLRIDAPLQGRLLALADGPDPLLPARQVTLFGIALHDVLLFGQPGHRVTAWIPGDSRLPLYEYDSLHSLARQLKTRLCQAGFRRFFLGFVPHDQQAHVLHLLQYHLADGDNDVNRDWTLQDGAQLHLDTLAIDGEPFTWLWQQYTARARQQALQLAVPTADIDAQRQQQLRDTWNNAALTFLNAAAFFVPGLGEAMMAVVAWQLLDEVIEGAQAWQQGDVDTALAHLESVALNVGVIVGLGVAGKVLPKLFNSTVMERLVPVRRADGNTRLWRPQLDAYRSPHGLGEDTAANALGQYVEGARHYLKLDGAVFEQRFDPTEGQWRLVHPVDASAYQPVLEHNGQGSWRLAHEQPLTWSTPRLLRRLGPMTEGLDDAELEQARLISATSAGELRRMQVHNEPTPPLLGDTLERLQAWRQVRGTGRGIEAFDTVYDAPMAADERVNLLLRRFPRLTRPLARRLIDSQAPAWQVQQAPPARLLQQAAQVNQDLPLVRAFEGLHLPQLANSDSQRLIFACLERLPGWSPALRMELRGGSSEGPLLARAGTPQAAQRLSLVRRADGYRSTDAEHSTDLVQAIHDALPAAQRMAMYPGGESGQLNAKLLALASEQRSEVPRWLWSGRTTGWPEQGRLRGGFERLRDYPQGEVRAALNLRYRRLFPASSDDETQVQFTRWHDNLLNPDTQVQALEQQYDTLQRDLQLWAGNHPSRRDAIEIFTRSWQRVSIRRLDDDTWIHTLELDLLDLQDQDLASLQLPGGFEHVQELSLEDNHHLTQLPPSWLQQLPQLQRLSLRGNRFNHIPQVPYPERLLSLDLEENRITWDAQQQQRLNQHTQLHALSLANNPLIEAPDVSTLTELVGLDMSNTSLTRLPVGLQIMQEPFLLNLSSNQFTHLPEELMLPFDSAQAMRLESEYLSQEVLEQIDAYYQREGVDLLVAHSDYDELLQGLTAWHLQIWEQLPLTYRRDLRSLYDTTLFDTHPDIFRERFAQQLGRLGTDNMFRMVALGRPASDLLTLQVRVIG